MKKHYTYLIRNKITKKLYIGVRSYNGNPTEDINYMSSSIYLLEEIKNNKDLFQKRILKVFSSRKKALEHEIYLHQKYNVGVNNRFFNKAKQTSIGFDITGTKHTKEWIQKAKKRIGKKASFYGKNHSSESKQKIREASLNQKNRGKGFEGKKHSIKTKQILSELAKGRKWYNNGKIECLFCPELEPIGFIPGRISICNPRTDETKKKIGSSKLGRKWYTNGKDIICRMPGEEPIGYVLGKKLKF